MKFLVLVLCVCAASAAVYTPYQSGFGFKPEGSSVTAFATVKSAKPSYPEGVQISPVPLTKSNVKYTDSEAPIVKYENNYNPETKSYSFSYETGNGIAASSYGTVKRIGENDVLEVQGSYQYYTPEGIPVVFTYVADENGYHPKSDLLPVAPEIPEAIARSLEYIATHPKYETKANKF